MPKKDVEFVSTTEAAKRLRLSRQRVLQLIESGKLQAQKFADVYMIPATDLKLIRNRKPGRPKKLN